MTVFGMGYEGAVDDSSFAGSMATNALFGGPIQHGFERLLGSQGGHIYSRFPAFSGGLTNNRFGMAMKGGFLAPFGMQLNEQRAADFLAGGKVPGGNFSFMGWRNVQQQAFTAGASPKTFSSTLGWAMKNQKFSENAFRFLGPVMGIASVGTRAIEGYREEGVWGGVKGGFVGAAEWAAVEVGSSVAASVLGVSAGALTLAAGAIVGGAAAGFGIYKGLEAGREHRRGLRKSEFASEVVDPFGFGFTMRQRSLAAIQRSVINGRLAMGNEALLMHTSLMR